MGSSFTPLLLTRAAARGKAVNDSTSPAVAKLLLAPDRDAKLDVLNTYREQLTSQQARADLATIVRRVGGDTWFGKATPLLGEFGAPGKAEFVLDYQELRSDRDRDRLLIGDQGRGIDVSLRVHLIQESGHSSAAAATAMHAVDLMFTDGLSSALQYVKQNSAGLPVNDRQRWVDSIADLGNQHTDKRADLQQLAKQVLTC
ncbi:hypothetical protein ACLQ24_20020 [Micromonospora sp. DT4]|uniref:hypothetical protein n=1 Tax=Micromonospora sp. DT4 TaxID=3393438 RepID=UPI003CF8CDFE